MKVLFVAFWSSCILWIFYTLSSLKADCSSPKDILCKFAVLCYETLQIGPPWTQSVFRDCLVFYIFNIVNVFHQQINQGETLVIYMQVSRHIPILCQ